MVGVGVSCRHTKVSSIYSSCTPQILSFVEHGGLGATGPQVSIQYKYQGSFKKCYLRIVLI